MDDERLMMLYINSKKKKKRKVKRISNYEKRESHGGFKLSSEILDSVFKESFGLNMNEFNEVRELIKIYTKNKNPRSTKQL